MSSVFSVLPPVKKGFFARLFSTGADENAFIELNNLLAAKPLLQITTDDVAVIITKYNVDITRHFPGRVKNLFYAYFQHCIQDRSFGEEEKVALRHLKRLLQLSDVDIIDTQKKIEENALIAEWKKAVADGRLTKEEEEALDKLAASFTLPDDLVKQISALTRELHYRETLKTTMDDRRLTDEEEAELKAISESLNVTPQFDEATQSVLDRFRLYYQIENGILPEYSVDINLLKGEVCHFGCAANWHEYRSVTRRVNYAGPAVSVKIMRGVYYRAGSMSVQPVRSQELQLIGSGMLYLTNKRVIFVGDNKATTIRYNKIVTMNPYSNGVEIIKDAGKSPTITVANENAEMMNLVLARLISSSGEE